MSAKSGAERQAEYRVRRAQEIEALRNEAASHNDEPSRDELKAEVEKLKREVMRARDLLYSANAQVRELESQQRKWARDKSLFNGIGKRLTMDQYKLILGLVHPDRHPGNEARAQLAFLAFKKLEKTVYTKQASRNEPSRNEEQEPSRNEASRNEAQAAIPAH